MTDIACQIVGARSDLGCMHAVQARPRGLEIEPPRRLPSSTGPMSSFEALPTTRQARGAPLSDAELVALGDEELVAYIARARRAGNGDSAVSATHILLYRHEERMRSRIALRLPEHLWHHRDTVAEWVLERVARSALRLNFEGETIGEWISWWTTAINLKVISFWRSAQGQALEAETELPSEAADETSNRPPRRQPSELTSELDVEALCTRLVSGDVVERVLRQTRNPTHRRIIRDGELLRGPSKVVAARHGTTPNNVDQIRRRFRTKLAEELRREGIDQP
jgi:hypothetical protein